MLKIAMVGRGLTKNGLPVWWADSWGRAELRKKLRWDHVLAIFRPMQPCFVATAAFGGAHFHDREIDKLRREMRLIPPADGKPFAKRHKNDAADAEAICEVSSWLRSNHVNGPSI